MRIRSIYIAHIRNNGTYEVRADRGVTHIVMGTVISLDVAKLLAQALADRYGVSVGEANTVA